MLNTIAFCTLLTVPLPLPNEGHFSTTNGGAPQLPSAQSRPFKGRATLSGKTFFQGIMLEGGQEGDGKWGG